MAVDNIKIFKTISSYLSQPLKKELPLFLILIGLVALTNLYFWCHFNAYSYSFYIFSENVITIYLLIVALSFFRGWWYKIFKFILILWGIIWCIIDSFCFIELLVPFRDDIGVAIRGTNISEAKEFIDTFFTKNVLYHIITFISISFLIGYIIKREHYQTSTYISKIVIIYMIIMTVLLVRNSDCFKENPLYKTVQLFNPCITANAKSFNKSFEVSNSASTMPNKIILIIGESFSRHHSSIYGYRKETNPSLMKLKNTGDLIIYSNAIGSEISTIPSFKNFMSIGNGKEKDWYDYPVIPTLLKKAGYNTIWVSNQSKHGLYDNLVSVYSELCDSSVFLGNIYSGLYRNNFDDEILEHLHEINNSNDRNIVYFVHLMGSHPDFSKRYPLSREKFKSKDYEDCIESQRSQLASYDNSILYNDSVVSEIMNIFKDDESLVFYFSDHGYDVFYSDPNYIGQARSTSQISMNKGREIPFMVYMSPKFKEHFPEKVKYIEDEADKPFNTDSLINYIMHITDISIKE